MMSLSQHGLTRGKSGRFCVTDRDWLLEHTSTAEGPSLT
jgi:hypothetical protein